MTLESPLCSLDNSERWPHNSRGLDIRGVLRGLPRLKLEATRFSWLSPGLQGFITRLPAWWAPWSFELKACANSNCKSVRASFGWITWKAPARNPEKTINREQRLQKETDSCNSIEHRIQSWGCMFWGCLGVQLVDGSACDPRPRTWNLKEVDIQS